MASDELKALVLSGGSASPTPIPTPAGIPPRPAGATGEMAMPLALARALAGGGSALGSMASTAAEDVTSNPGKYIGSTLASFAVPGGGAAGALALRGALAAGVGGAAGQNIEDLIRSHTGSTSAPETYGQALLSAVSAGNEMALGESIGRGAMSVVGKAIAPLAGKFNIETAPAVAEMRGAVANARTALGATLQGRRTAAVMPQEVNRAAFIDGLAKLADADNAGRDQVLSAIRNRRHLLVDEPRERIIQQLGRNLDGRQFGEAFAAEVRGNYDIAKAPAVQIENALREVAAGQRITQNVPVRTRSLTGGTSTSSQVVTSHAGGLNANMDAVRSRLGAVYDRYQDTQFKSGSDALDSFIRRLGRGPAQKNWTELLDDRKELRQLMRAGMASADTGTKRQIRSLGAPVERELTNELRRSIGTLDPMYAQHLDLADRIYSGAAREYNERTIFRLSQYVDQGSAGVAEDIIQKIFGPIHGTAKFGPQRLEQVRQALTYPATSMDPARPAGQLSPAWGDLQQWYVRALVRESRGETGEFSASALSRNLARERDNGRMAAVLNNRPATIDALTALARQGRFAETGGRSATEPLLGVGIVGDSITLAGRQVQTSDPLTVRLAKGVARLATVPIGGMRFPSWLAGRLLTSERGARLLSEGFRLPANSPAAAGLLAKLTVLAQAEERAMEFHEGMRQRLIGTPTAGPQMGSAL